MQSILLATAIAMVIALLGTPYVIDIFRRWGVGQFVREDGPTTHLVKHGTPTMGGLVFLGAGTLAYIAAHIRLSGFALQWRPFSTAALLVLASAWALGLLGAI